MKHLGLFEGIGGFSLAARWMGWETIAQCEIDEFCIDFLNIHYPNAKKHQDIRTTDFSIYRGSVDILTGGFPCQPYSIAGKRLGKADERHLWPEMLRAIQEIQPRWIVGENVFGLLNWNNGMVFDQVCLDLENQGYEVQAFVLPACSVDAPHKRDRVWIVAYRIDARFKDLQESQNGFFKSEDAANANSNGLQGWSMAHQSQASGRQIKQLCSCDTPPGFQEFPSFAPVCGGNDGLSSGIHPRQFSAWRKQMIKALGNAVVPQVVLQIYKTIQQFENENNH